MYYHHCVLTTNAGGKGSKSHPRFLTCPPGSSKPSLMACLFSDVSSYSPDPLSFRDHPGLLDLLHGHKLPTPEFFIIGTRKRKTLWIASLSSGQYILLVD
jgi:hypothetical protein